MVHKTIVLGGGITGISAGYKQPDTAVYEAKDVSGGICASYYITPTEPDQIHYDRIIGEEDYRFELGGGHWVFGGNASTLDFIHNLTPMQRYERKASVYLPDADLFVPYPIQNHLYALGKPLATKIYEELSSPSNMKIATMQDWLMHHFGPTLNTIFFKPFHDLYTANLTNQIVPQDPNKTPLDLKAIKLGLRSKTPNAGYNTTFLYPKNGLNT
ncbi:MAG: protoporphyrinogen oxidase, partial [Candidatus Omnitrophota bacterium]